MNVYIAYIVGFLLTFFAASFMVARCCRWEDPTNPSTFLLLIGLALIWPITVPLFAAVVLLMGMAMLANKLSDKLSESTK